MRLSLIVLALGVAVLAFSQPVRAQSWIAGNGDWWELSNWNPASAPSNALIDNGGTATLSADASIAALSLAFNGQGSLEHTAGTLNASNIVQLGCGTGTGNYRMTNATLITNRLELGGGPGVGIFDQVSGNTSVDWSLIGSLSTGPGTYYLKDGSFTVREGGCVGPNGLLQQSGGVSQFKQLDVWSGGRYRLEGGLANATNGLRVMPGGTLNMTGGSLLNGGIVDLSQGTLTSNGLASYQGQPNTLLVLPAGVGPSSVFANYSNAGLLANGGGTITIPAGAFVHGDNTFGTLISVQGTLGDPTSNIVPGGGLLVSEGGYVDLGGTAGGLEIDVPVSGMTGGYLRNGHASIGHAGTGMFVQTGGLHVSDDFSTGAYSGSTGVYELHGGSLSCLSGTAKIGKSGLGYMKQYGGTFTATKIMLGYGSWGTGHYQMQGGSVRCQGLSATSRGTFSLQGGLLDAGNVSITNFSFTGGTLRPGYFASPGLTNQGGTLSPGRETSMSTMGGTYRQLSGYFEVDLGRHTNLTVTDSASLGGTLLLTGHGYRPTEGEYYTLVTVDKANAISGEFAAIVSDLTTGGQGQPLFAKAKYTFGTKTYYTVTFRGLSGGDANGDHIVNVGDLGILAGNWGLTGRSWASGDFNGDGAVNIGDLGMLAGNWGWSLASSGGQVPEPASLALIAAGMMGLLARRGSTARRRSAAWRKLTAAG